MITCLATEMTKLIRQMGEIDSLKSVPSYEPNRRVILPDAHKCVRLQFVHRAYSLQKIRSHNANARCQPTETVIGLEVDLLHGPG